MLLFSLGIILVLETFFLYGSGIVTSALNVKITTKINEKFIRIVRNISIKNFDDSKFCDTFYIAKEGFNNIPFVTESVLYFLGSIITFVTSMGIIVRTSYLMSAFVLVPFIIGYILNMWSGKVKHDFWKESVNNRRFSDYIANLFFSKSSEKEIRSYQMMPFLLNKWSKLTDQLKEDTYKINKKSNKFFAYYQLFMDISNLILLAMSIFVAGLGYIVVGDIITIWQLNRNILQSVQTINSAYSDLYFNNEKIAEAKRFFQLYLDNDESKIQDSFISQEKLMNTNVFELKNVSFSYMKNNEIIKDLNLTIKNGETIAICGENGSGKSTLVKLLLGLYMPDKGEVYINGVHSHSITPSSVGVAFQDYVCYPFTLRANVGFGYLKSLYNNEAIHYAMHMGGAYELLNKMQLESLLTKSMDDNGNELSGGEWQRIALSRANMNNKPIMIFDEPAAKLDPLGELKQFSQIQNVMHGRTVILISHRIGFAKLAQRIIVMRDGKIIEDGSHEELLRKNGEYKRMFKEQAQWYDTSWETGL